MKLIEQLSKFEYDLREKVDMVLDSDASSLRQLKEELCYFRSAEPEDITFSTKDGHLFVHYTYRGCWDEDEEFLTPLGFTRNNDGTILLNGLDYQDSLGEEVLAKARDIFAYYLEDFEELKTKC